MPDYHLFTPGPTPVPDKVRMKMADQVIYHRSQEFIELFTRVNHNLQYLFQTSQPVLTLACSGTGGMEATFVNLFSPGDTIISVNNGKFGARWVDMPRSFGLNVAELKLDWGEAPTPEQILGILKKHRDAKAVYLVHCETSTGTATDVRMFSQVIKDNSSALVCVDGVSAVGALEFRFDEWNIDVCVTASQKGLMVPPGLAFVALSEKAIEIMKLSMLPKYYFDFTKLLDAYRKDQTPWTPAISLLMGLDESLMMIRNEGLETIWKRHQILGNALRAGINAIGLKILSKHPSDSVTAVLLPTDIEWTTFNNVLKNKYGCIVGRGQGDFSNKLFRIAHIGVVSQTDIILIISSLERALTDFGKSVEIGSGIKAVKAEITHILDENL